MHGEYFRSKMGQILKVRHRSGRFYSTFQIFSALFSDTNSEVDDLIQILKYSVKYSVKYFQTLTAVWTIQPSTSDQKVREALHQSTPLYPLSIPAGNTTYVIINIIAINKRYSLSLSVQSPSS